MTTTTVTAYDGLTLPTIGFGTYKLKGNDGVETIARAINHGYTLLDSAFNYENEGTVGAAVRASGVDREQLIVTSKLPGRHHAFDQALVTVEESVLRTGLDYLDLYLIHWPNPVVNQYVEAWQALLEAKDRGLIKAVGVCNFLPEHLERLQSETGVLPSVNQIELHPYFPQLEALAYHRECGILTEGWSPLGRAGDVLIDPTIKKIADQHGVSSGEVILAWHVAVGSIPIPKASSDERQTQNLAAASLELTEEDISTITALGRPDGRIADQDPAVYEEF